MNNDFSDVLLNFPERLILFYLRFKKSVPERNIHQYCGYLQYLNLIALNNNCMKSKSELTYSLIDRYKRYLIYRRQKFFRSVIIPIVISVVTSVVTVLVLRRLGLQ